MMFSPPQVLMLTHVANTNVVLDGKDIDDAQRALVDMALRKQRQGKLLSCPDCLKVFTRRSACREHFASALSRAADPASRKTSLCPGYLKSVMVECSAGQADSGGPIGFIARDDSMLGICRDQELTLRLDSWQEENSKGAQRERNDGQVTITGGKMANVSMPLVDDDSGKAIDALTTFYGPGSLASYVDHDAVEREAKVENLRSGRRT